MPEKGIHYLHECCKELSLQELILNRNSNVQSYEDQVVLVLYQSGIYHKSPTRPIVDPYLLHKIATIQRNSFGQIYLVHDLQSSLHFAVPKVVAEVIWFRISYFFGKTSIGKNIFPPMMHMTNEKNHMSPDHRMMVINNDEPNAGGDTIKECSAYLETACKEGLLDDIQFTEKSRGGEASSPVMQFGWTQTDCNQYADNRINSVGSVGPFVCTNDSKNLSSKCKEALVKCIDTALKSCPKAHETFSTNNNDFRRELCDKFNLSLDFEYRKDKKKKRKRKSKKESDKVPTALRITCEAFTIIIPLTLSAHGDIMNDSEASMNSVVQINAKIPLNEMVGGFDVGLSSMRGHR